ncbi:uncharacterized protein ARMOST_11934 [Armillaria ostoyae]|uniref:Uncharacterized protein n=1 Tax=Armillaria ostoyae TaxID=47428 RepID=A0A284RII0_ARMOS|nr:uncharacterized protein ARMOST_11934 [Armillaria ostoyae]
MAGSRRNTSSRLADDKCYSLFVRPLRSPQAIPSIMAPARKKISRDNKENIAVASQQRRTRTAPVALLEKATMSTITSLRRSKRSRRPLARLDDNAIPAKVLPHCDAQNYPHENSPHYSMPEFDSYSLPFQSAFDISTEIFPEENYPCCPLINPFCDLRTLFRDSEVSFKQPPVSPFFFVPYFVEGKVLLIPLQSNTFPRPRPQTLTGLKTHLKPFSDSLFLSDAFPDELPPGNSEVDPFENVARMSPGTFCISVGFTIPDEDGHDWAL